ncbi:MAG: hypothetical protein R3E95_05055 [Thiolinea sp.]
MSISCSVARNMNILNACPDLYERTIVLNGVSKAYAMTGGALVMQRDRPS